MVMSYDEQDYFVYAYFDTVYAGFRCHNGNDIP